MRKATITIFLLTLAILNCANSVSAEFLPRFMIIIDEKNLGTYSMGDTENILAQILIDKGAEVVDRELVKTTLNRDKALQAMSGSPQAASALGLQFGADIVLVGRAIAKGSADRVENTDLRSYNASITLKAIRADTAEIICTESASAAKIHMDDVVGGSLAIKAATHLIADKIITKILAKHSEEKSGAPQRLQLVVGDVTKIWQVAALKQLLREDVKNVEDIVQRSFVTGVATFEVYYKGSSQKLAEELTMHNHKYIRLKVTGISPRKLDLKLLQK